MLKNKSSTIVVLLCLFTTGICTMIVIVGLGFVNPGNPVIIEVSTTLGMFVPPVGSIQGGTLIYIKGTNFSPNPDDNKVSIGPYPCILLADGAKQDTLTCRTTPAPTNSTQLRLPISVKVGLVSVICNSNNCAFTYFINRTPYIQQIIPRSAVGGASIQIFGLHRINDLGDGRSTSGTEIDNLLIGDRECTTTDILQNQDIYNPGLRSPIECRVDPTQSVGQYDFTELVSAGFARKSLRVYQTSYFTGKNYTQRVLAQITSMSAHQGGSKGQSLIVKGSGFPKNITQYSCIISGEPCTITTSTPTQLTIQVPPLPLTPKSSKLPQQVDDTTTQTKPYLGGNGLKYRRYDRQNMSKNTSEWLRYLRATPSNNLVSEKIITELSSPEIYGENYVEYVTGYFYAPVAGVYRFGAMSDDDFLMVMSTVMNNANVDNLQMLLAQQQWNSNHYIPQNRVNVTQNIKIQSLSRGYYYFQLININMGGPGYFKVIVDMPSLRPYTINPTWQLDKITIKPAQVDSEVINVRVFAANGTFDLYYYDAGNVLKIANVPVNASASLFRSRLGALTNIITYDPTVTLTTLDANGNPTNVTSSVKGYLYTITISRYRPPTPLPLVRTTNLVGGSTPMSATITRSATHSPPLSGTFTLLINNLPLLVDSSPLIPYNVSSSKIETAINSFYYATQIRVVKVMNTYSQDSVEFVIEYVGVYRVPYGIGVDTGLMGGGKVGTLPIKMVQVLRDYSNRQLYSPIPYDFLYLASPTPTLSLTLQKIPTLCFDCSYQYLQTSPTITSVSRTNNQLSVTLTNPSPQIYQYQLSDITVTYMGGACVGLVGNVSSFGCQLGVNSDGTVLLEAGGGLGTVKVHVGGVGYADGDGLLLETVPLTVNSITPTQSSPGGGIQATIVGTGFPLSASPSLSITICGNKVTTYTQTTNTQVSFLLPPQTTTLTCLPTNTYLSFNSQQSSFSFSYNPNLAPVISSLSISSASPVLKSMINITGTNFGRRNQTVVYLRDNRDNGGNGGRKYQLAIVGWEVGQGQGQGRILCVLGGGRTGLYDVVVQDKFNGASTPNANTKFSYKMSITSISPSTGHKGGGYPLTITGYNFPPTPSLTILIGPSKNNICSIVTSNSTTITCIVPRMLDQYAVGVVVPVVALGRIVEESVCQGTCGFGYGEVGVVKVGVVGGNGVYKGGDLVTIAGTGLRNAVVSVNNVNCTIVGNNDTALNFTYPALAAGSYQILIKVGNGWTYPQLMSTTLLSIDSAAISSASYYGAQFKVIGNGLPATSYISAFFVCTNTTQLKILQSNQTTIMIHIPKYTTDISCRINVTALDTYRIFSFSYQPSRICNITLQPIPPQSSTLSRAYTLIKNNMTTYIPHKVQFILLDTAGNPTTSKYLMNIVNVNSSVSNVSIGYLPVGDFYVRVHSSVYGYAYLYPDVVTNGYGSNLTGFGDLAATDVVGSFVGGKQVVINGTGFVTNNPNNNQVTVCGLPATIISATQTNLTISLPPLITPVTQSLYSLAQPTELSGTTFSDSPLPPSPSPSTSTSSSPISDNSFNTIYTSPNPSCYIGLNFGDGAFADISQIRYVPNPEWDLASLQLDGAVFQGSHDGVGYEELFGVDSSQVHSGWNSWKKGDAVYQYQYVRFRHNSLSACQLAQLKILGIKHSRTQISPTSNKTCNISILTSSNKYNKILPNTATYSHSSTTIVTQITPSFGPSIGGETLYLKGIGFGGSVSVRIDGVDCVVASLNLTDLVCVTGRRVGVPAGNSFVVVSDGNTVRIAAKPYLYVDRWSNTETWGGEAIPREGDSVYVPKGMTLLVDQSTPILDSVIVQGKIQFQDRDLTFDCNYFIINGGQFEAGTETNRFQHSLTITLHGGYSGKQLPILGNKVLGCRNCRFNMHGRQRLRTWTLVAETIRPGDVSFGVVDRVDWVVGEKIVVAATGFDHYQSQQKQIGNISSDGLTITTTTPFKYRHYSAIETYGNESFPMRAEVGLLTRNIVVRGNAQSATEQHGSHLMLTGKQANGLVGKISYVEFTKCGQPRIVGRYCTHFHMAGEVPDSYIRGISVHHSYARVLTIHGTHYLLVQKNIGYHVKGHNIFIQDGIETNNIIQDNLMISSITSNTLLQSDITVASYWITNPTNTVRRNHAAGGDFYGFWYEIKDHPDGPSATNDVCPIGMRLGVSEGNVAHSNRRFGLRVFKLSARKYPCIDTIDQSAQDPYLSNPPIKSTFSNYTLWKNEQCNFLGQQLGYTSILNFKSADSRKSGLQFHKTNFTKELVTAENCLIVGYSAGNGPVDVDVEYNNARGIIAARTDGLLVKNVRFYNFGSRMTPLQSCSECYNVKVWVTGGKTTLFENIQYYNIQGKYIFWQKWRRQIFIDLDGTMSKPFQQSLNPPVPPQSKSVISPYRPSLMIPGHCYRDTNNLWDNSVYCDETVTMRGILFTNGIPEIDFNAISVKVNLLGSAYENVSGEPQSMFSNETMIIIKKSRDIKNSWAMPFATNNYYNIHWKLGLDFTHMSIAPSRLWSPTEGVVLRFNYSDARQMFQIGKWYQQQLQLPFIIPSPTLINPATCQNSDYYHDSVSRYLFVCVSGRNKKIREWIDVNGIRCLNFCPTTNPDLLRETFSRLWSNATQWPNQTLPAVNQNVTIPFEWNLILDMDPPILKYLQINGNLIFDRARDNKLQAHYIWVRKGTIKIGTESVPFTKQANIILHGAKGDNYLVIDGQASGNKMIAVTGGLEFYGILPEVTWTRLTAIAYVNATQISVVSCTGWKIGDRIVIAPSYSGRKQFQQVRITAINGNNITFTPALVYEHYGAQSVTIQNSYGVLDARSAVGMLTRNIKISAAPDPNNWGCRVLVYGYREVSANISVTPIWRNGYAKLKAVQIDNCGQSDTTMASLSLQNLNPPTTTATPITPSPLQTTQIQSSTIHNCNSFCTLIKQSSNIHINNNIFFNARKFLVYVEDIVGVGNYNFTNNLLVGAKKRDELADGDSGLHDDVAAYQQYFGLSFANPNLRVNVSFNLVQGSEGEGFVFPATPCKFIDTYPFVNNTAGSCQIAFMYQKMDGQSCLAAKGSIGYASEIGLMANMPGIHQRVQYSKMFFADNERGVTLRYAHQIDDNTLVFSNSYVVGFSRPNCTTCYGPTKISYCAGGYAVRMLSVTITGQTFPLKKKPTGHDVICTQEAYDAKAYLDGVTFQNYLYNNTQLPYCSGMSVFKRHNLASDSTGSHYLTNTRCINCQKKSWAYFDKPSPAWRGWFGGCGQLDCTGPHNYLIHDQDGLFTGEKSQLLANNSMIGDYESSCQFVAEMNGQWCHTEEFAVLEYQSIAPDYNKRKMWPVFLAYDGGLWNSTTNGWKEWQWNGAEPMNLRLARFWSVVKLHQKYNLTYSSQPPSDSRYQLQKRVQPTGKPTDWIIVRISHPIPNSLQILIKNSTNRDTVVKPYPILQNIATDLTTKTDICGANNFYYQNGTIEFVVNGRANCQVRVRVSSYVQLSARIQVNFADFYGSNGVAIFIAKICAFLGIDTGRLKVVGLREGSVQIQAVINSVPTSINDSENTTIDKAAEQAELNALNQKLKQGLLNGSINFNNPLLSFTTNHYSTNQDGTTNPYSQPQPPTPDQHQTTTIILAIVIPLLIIILILMLGLVLYLKRRSRKIIQFEGENRNEENQEKKTTANSIVVRDMVDQGRRVTELCMVTQN